MAEGWSVGLSFGNSAAVVSVCKGGKADVLANDLGERTTPTAVALTNDEWVTGLAARNGIVRKPRSTIVQFHRLLGAKFADLEGDRTWKSYCQPTDKDGSPVFPLTKDDESVVELSPQQAATHVFANLKTTASQAGSLEAVAVAVPFSFSDEQRKQLKAAAEAAGLHVVRLVHEHVAALLAYGIASEHRGSPATYVVVDVGGSQTAVSVVAVRNGMFTTLAHAADPRLGGRDIDAVVVEQLAQEFKRKSRHDVKEDVRAMAKLLVAAESAKKTLSSRPSAAVSIESLYEGVDLQCEVARMRVEVAIGAMLRRLADLVTGTLGQVNVAPADVCKVILCGGTSRFPPIKAAVQQLFPPSILDDSLATDEVFALGASRVAESGELEGEDVALGKPVSLAATSVDVGLRGDDGAFIPLIVKQTALPVRQKCTVSTSEDSQPSIAMEICQRNADATLTPLARIAMKNLPDTPRGLTRVELTLHIDKHNALHLHATEPSSGQSVSALVAAEAR